MCVWHGSSECTPSQLIISWSSQWTNWRLRVTTRHSAIHLLMGQRLTQLIVQTTCDLLPKSKSHLVFGYALVSPKKVSTAQYLTVFLPIAHSVSVPATLQQISVLIPLTVSHPIRIHPRVIPTKYCHQLHKHWHDDWGNTKRVSMCITDQGSMCKMWCQI